MVIEISKNLESYNDLLDDAAIKHFSTQTSVRVWIGVKLHSGHGGRLRYKFRPRDPVNGGALANSGASTDYISLYHPTSIEFIIPKSEVFWGVKPPLPPTHSTVPGPNALPQPQVPRTPTDDLVLPVEELRDAALAFKVVGKRMATSSGVMVQNGEERRLTLANHAFEDSDGVYYPDVLSQGLIGTVELRFPLIDVALCRFVTPLNYSNKQYFTATRLLRNV